MAAAAALRYLLFATSLLALLAQGMSQGTCVEGTLGVDQVETGKIIKGKKEYEVTVSNICDCPQRNVTMDCDGFQTVEKVDPKLMKVRGIECILLEGRDIIPREDVVFNYAWDEDYPFYFLSAKAICPP